MPLSLRSTCVLYGCVTPQLTCVCGHSRGTLAKPWTLFLSGVLSDSHWFANLPPRMSGLTSDSLGGGRAFRPSNRGLKVSYPPTLWLHPPSEINLNIGSPLQVFSAGWRSIGKDIDGGKTIHRLLF